VELFDYTLDYILRNQKNIFKDKELDEAVTAEEFSVVKKE